MVSVVLSVLKVNRFKNSFIIVWMIFNNGYESNILFSAIKKKQC